MKNGVNLLLDSNIFIYWLTANIHPAEILAENDIHFSIITEIEIKGHLTFTTKNQKLSFQKVLNRFEKIGLTEEIKDKILYNLKTPDAIIAATAKSLKLPLVTGDKKLLKVEDIITVHFNPEI